MAVFEFLKLLDNPAAGAGSDPADGQGVARIGNRQKVGVLHPVWGKTRY
jgi:hypothetical protein